MLSDGVAAVIIILRDDQTTKTSPERVNIIVARVEEYQILFPGRVEELSRGNNKHLQRQLRRQHHLLNPQWEMTGTENISLDSVSQHTERTEANRLLRSEVYFSF